jgi:hypothetical protein
MLPPFESTNRRITVGEKAYMKMLPMPTGNQPIAKANWEIPTNSKSAGERMSVIDNILYYGLSLARGQMPASGGAEDARHGNQRSDPKEDYPSPS